MIWKNLKKFIKCHYFFFLSYPYNSTCSPRRVDLAMELEGEELQFFKGFKIFFIFSSIKYYLNIQFKWLICVCFFLCIGKVDYVGSSHQWWHFLVVLALYYWHNTGILYIEYRMNHGCAHDLRLWWYPVWFGF